VAKLSTIKAFEVLGLPETSEPAAVKDRWRELAMVHHPDRAGGDALEFDKLHKAYKQAMAEALSPKTCPTCGGKGFVVQAYGFDTLNVLCRECGGEGKVKPQSPS
jgi:DnaJ-class molecular chaperone